MLTPYTSVPNTNSELIQQSTVEATALFLSLIGVDKHECSKLVRCVIINNSHLKRKNIVTGVKADLEVGVHADLDLEIDLEVEVTANKVVS